MHVLNKYAEAENFRPYCVALGSFDGVHLGHQHIINSMIKKSNELNANSLVYTFNIHPKKILIHNSSVSLITDNAKRIDIFSQMGLDYLYLEDFNNISKMEPEQFVKEILVKIFHVKHLFVGYNYHFGHKSSGDSKKLAELGEKYGFGVDIFSPITINDQIVSSSLVRSFIVNGNVDKVKDFLGREYSILGNVIYGKQIGAKIGIRTANISIDESFVVPKNGVYFTTSIINNKTYKSITNVGTNPTFHGESFNIETHLLNFNEDVYGDKIEIFFIKRIRDEKKFNNSVDLVSQINLDILSRLDYK